MTPAPLIRCLIAWPLAEGKVRAVRVVSLGAAYLALQDGWIVIGPDPGDMDRYVAWQREQDDQACNRPRLTS